MKNKEKVLAILASELEINVSKIDLNDPYASLENMDSLSQVSIINTLEQELELEFDFDDLFDIEIVQDLIDIVNSKSLE